MTEQARGVGVGVAVAAGRMAMAIQQDAQAEPTVVFRDHILHGAEEHVAVSNMSATVRESFQALGIDIAAIRVMGLSIGGHISPDGVTVHFAPSLVEPGCDWKEIDVVDLVRATTGKQSYVENDVNCMAAYQRAFGVARDCANFLVVYLAPDVQGLGCGIVANGRIIRGVTGGAGELGHLVIQPKGPRCRCGNRGCLEALLAVDNFDRDLNWGGQTHPRGFTTGAELVRNGNHRALRTFERAGRYLGQGLANIMNILNPEMIVLGGPSELVQEAPDEGSSSAYFMEAMHRSVGENAFSRMATDCNIKVVDLDLGIAATGALLLAEARTVDSTEGRLP